MSYEDYIDEYYESAMTAEKLYDRFIEVALELQKWIDEIDNVVVKEYREALSWGIYSKNKKIRKRFNELKNEIESKVNAFIQSSELYVMEDTFQWVILPFDTSLLPYKYNGKFWSLVDLMTEHPHGDVFGDGTNVPDFHEYDEQSDMDYYEMCQVFHCGIENCQRLLDGGIQRWVRTIHDARGASWDMRFIGIFEDGLARIEDVRNNQKRMAWDLCRRLNESLSGDEIYEACDFAVRGGRPLW